MKNIHLRLEADEALDSRRNLLLTEINLLNLRKIISEYLKLRKEEFLKKQGPDIYPEGIVTGNFLELTKKAVIRFQEKYREEILEPLGIYDYYELEEVSIDIGENRFIFMLREKETSPYNTGDWFLEFNGEEWVMVFSYILGKVSEESLKKMRKVKAPFRFTIILSQAENKSALAVKIMAKRIHDFPKLDKISKLLSIIRGYVVECK